MGHIKWLPVYEIKRQKPYKDELSRYMNNCIYFRAFNECDKTTDVACVPEQIQNDNHVRITCGPSNTFDQGSFRDFLTDLQIF